MSSLNVKLAIVAAFSAFVLESRATETAPKPAAAAPAAQPAAAQPAAKPAAVAPKPANAKPATAPAAAPAAEGVAVQNAPAPAPAGKGCEDVKAQIDAKLKAKGVKTFTLDIVGKEDVKDAKVVGSCEGGKKKIAYKRG